MDQKDEKISKLRALLGQANSKIRSLKQLLLEKVDYIYNVVGEAGGADKVII